MAKRLAQELRRALVANPHSPAANVRVVSDVEFAHEMRHAAATAILSGYGGAPADRGQVATLPPVEFAD